jgi:hypothetical protein
MLSAAVIKRNLDADGDRAGGAMRNRWRNLAVAGALVLAGSFMTSGPAVALTAPVHHEPTLGVRTGLFAHGSGFGQVAPTEVFNGGDPTGLVTSIIWHGWGGPQATGIGRGLYVAPGQAVAQGTIESVRIVAFDLGTCNGRYMYAAVEWYFPQHKQAFDPGQFEDVCTGEYYPPQTGRYADGGTGAGYYLLTLSGTPGSLRGSITAAGKASRTVFSFHGRAGINGSLTLISKGPFGTGRTFKGTWQTSSVILANCRAYLHSAPSCTFYPG